ncbi:MAG: hypothetical protein LBT85_00190 [Bifidobacteriaceae bacterium]|jgi:hypothetical protein|nr:hypothetical protein [Bifidobacteriaceae bacterium]
MKVKNSYNIDLSSITNIKRTKGRPKGSTKLETSYGLRHLRKVLYILRNWQKYQPVVEPSDSDLEYERQRKVSASVPYLRLDKDRLAQLGAIYGVAANFGVAHPNKLEGYCVDGYYDKLVELFSNSKDYLDYNYDLDDNLNNLDKYKISLKSCRIIDFDKIKSFGVGLVSMNKSFYIVCVTMDLQRFCWRIRKIEIVPNKCVEEKIMPDLFVKRISSYNLDESYNLDRACNNLVVII